MQFETKNIWTYFGGLHHNEIPSFGRLFEMAQALWDSYSNPHAFTSLVTGHHLDQFVVPIGEPWRKEDEANLQSAPSQAMDIDINSKVCGGSGEDKGQETKGEGETFIGGGEFKGDHALARSASFIYEALVSKEVAQAVAEGDVGRVYEGIKVSLASIAGEFLTYITDDADHVCGIFACQVHQLLAQHNWLLGV